MFGGRSISGKGLYGSAQKSKMQSNIMSESKMSESAANFCEKNIFFTPQVRTTSSYLALGSRGVGGMIWKCLSFRTAVCHWSAFRRSSAKRRTIGDDNRVSDLLDLLVGGFGGSSLRAGRRISAWARNFAPSGCSTAAGLTGGQPPVLEKVEQKDNHEPIHSQAFRTFRFLPFLYMLILHDIL